jgi:hypothetical protein
VGYLFVLSMEWEGLSKMAGEDTGFERGGFAFQIQ